MRVPRQVLFPWARRMLLRGAVRESFSHETAMPTPSRFEHARRRFALALLGGVWPVAASALPWRDGTRPPRVRPTLDDIRFALATTEPAGAPPLAPAERAWARSASQTSLLLLALGQIAIRRTATLATQQLGAELVAHHSAAHAELAALCVGRVELSAPAEGPGWQALAELVQREGPELDRLFLHAVQAEAGEPRLGRLFEAARGVHDPLLQAWISKSLPAWQEQARAAHRLLAALPS